MSTLPLKAVSRLWGWFNGLTIPYYLRVPGFKLYSFIFGVKWVLTFLALGSVPEYG
jgi:phosphatidylserine decarboxylase